MISVSEYSYLITGFVKSTTLFLNAVYFGFSELSPVSTQVEFLTSNVALSLKFPEVSAKVSPFISTETSPS